MSPLANHNGQPPRGERLSSRIMGGASKPSKRKLNPDETNQEKLRQMCRALGVVPNWATGGDKNRKEYLSSVEMRFLIRRKLAESEVSKDLVLKEQSARDPVHARVQQWGDP